MGFEWTLATKFHWLSKFYEVFGLIEGSCYRLCCCRVTIFSIFDRVSEDTMLALANVARSLNDRGKLKEADKVFSFARFLQIFQFV